MPVSLFLKKKKKYLFSFSVVLDFRCCAGFLWFCKVRARLVVVHGLLTAVASLVVEHGL